MLQLRALRLLHTLALPSTLLGAVQGCGARAEDVAPGESPPGESEVAQPEQPGVAAAEPGDDSARLDCAPSQQVVCEALGSSAAERCECRDIVPGGAAGCALPGQLACSDAGAD